MRISQGCSVMNGIEATILIDLIYSEQEFAASPSAHTHTLNMHTTIHFDIVSYTFCRSTFLVAASFQRASLVAITTACGLTSAEKLSPMYTISL